MAYVNFARSELSRNDPSAAKAAILRRPGRAAGALGFIGLMLLVVTSCTVGPDFQKPEPAMPDRYSATAPHIPTQGQARLADWWTTFDDPVLDSLIQRAVASNLDLKLAEARVRQARAARGVAVGGLGPALDASGSYQRSHSSISATQTGQSGHTDGVTSDQYQAGFDAAWEIDIFGGRRRAVEAATADLQAAVESRRDVLVTLLAEAARDYIQLRGYQQQIAVTEKNLAVQKHTARITRERFRGGFVGALDVANADAQSATTAAQIPLLETSARQMIYSLSILLGEPPAALQGELTPMGTIPAAPPGVPVGVPSELLRRRPDIRQAEAQIHGATARIGIATADLFPKFQITGAAGYRAADSGSLLEWSNRFWRVGPSVLWNLFQSGALRANIEVQKALQEQEMIIYRQTVLGALQEVENALIASTKAQTRREALATAAKANRKAVDLATKLYTEGMTDFINVLQAQGSLYNTENALVQSDTAVSTDLVALYKALGGGWAADAQPSAAGEANTTRVAQNIIKIH